MVQAGSQGGQPSGPSSFANLRQMAGLQPGTKKRERGASSSLVSRLGLGGGSQGPGGQQGPKMAALPSFDAASAFFQTVLAPKNNRRK